MDSHLNIPAGMRLLEANDSASIRPLFSLMRQLRPALQNEDEWCAYFERASAVGYRLVVLYREAVPAALVSYRLAENLVHSRYLYVEDLVTDEHQRSQGCGEILLQWCIQRARKQGCRKVILDTGLANALAQRFYFRQGLLATSMRFAMVLDSASA